MLNKPIQTVESSSRYNDSSILADTMKVIVADTMTVVVVETMTAVAAYTMTIVVVETMTVVCGVSRLKRLTHAAHVPGCIL